MAKIGRSYLTTLYDLLRASERLELQNHEKFEVRKVARIIKNLKAAIEEVLSEKKVIRAPINSRMLLPTVTQELTAKEIAEQEIERSRQLLENQKRSRPAVVCDNVEMVRRPKDSERSAMHLKLVSSK